MSDTYLRSSSGLTVVNSAGKAFITTSYSSGIMSGDIKGAFLSDTSTASVTGTELVTNGTFDSNTTGWTAYSANGGSIDWQTGGYLRISNADTSDPPVHAYQAITTVVGQRYILTAQKVAGTHFTAYVSSGLNSSPGFIDSQLVWSDVETGVKFLSFTATVTTTYVILRVNINSIATVDVDNVSVRLADPDRSVNNKGLQVFGTLTKTPVATGSNLVAYSGWSTSNYLEQPYNSSIPMNSTDSLCIMAWTKLSNAANYSVIFASGGITNGRGRYLYTLSGIPHLDTYGGAGNQGNRSIADNVWHHLVAIYRPSGGQLYLDGKLFSSPTWTQGYLDQNTTNYPIRVGIDMTLNGATVHQGSIALLRVSNSIPSPEQIKKIYEDEKVLFQENAQCTLYGSSDAVTALAYDDTTELLSVGTSSGRSDFQGLRRINNTTTAVTTAISASNGLIAEQ